MVKYAQTNSTNNFKRVVVVTCNYNLKLLTEVDQVMLQRLQFLLLMQYEKEIRQQ